VVTYLYCYPSNATYLTRVQIPYLKDVFVDVGSLIILLNMVAIVGASNAVNLTDGLDGLVGGILVVNALTFGIFAYLAGNIKLALYLRLISVPGAGELTVYLAAMAGDHRRWRQRPRLLFPTLPNPRERKPLASGHG
jgi:phospho-N-acetylmuramoyl-pentapeptide-transferase